MDCSMPGCPVLHQILELAQTQVHRVSDAIQPSHPLWSPSPQAVNCSSFRVFSSEWVLSIRWPKYWSFTFIISPSNEYSGLISFRMDWFDLLAVQGALKSLLQHHSLKASILWLFIEHFLYPLGLCLQSVSNILDHLYYHYSEFFFRKLHISTSLNCSLFSSFVCSIFLCCLILPNFLYLWSLFLRL